MLRDKLIYLSILFNSTITTDANWMNTPFLRGGIFLIIDVDNLNQKNLLITY